MYCRNMTDSELKQLYKMKKLISCGKRKFVKRKDRDYIQDLLDIGISEEQAWEEVKSLSKADYWYDDKNTYIFDNDKALVFKKIINDVLTYIKLKIEKDKNGEITVCLSFHRDYKRVEEYNNEM